MRLALGILALATLAGWSVSSSFSAKEYRLAGFTTSLVGRSENQRHNAELSMAQLRTIRLRPGETFSFNTTVGSFSRDQGYRRAPVSYNGNLISSWGGGVCQTSTTLYNAALLAGMDVTERHRHRFAPSYVAPGRDSAVAFNTIDLKFTNPYDFDVTFRGRVVHDRLEFVFVGAKPLPEPIRVQSKIVSAELPRPVRMGEGERVRIRNSGKAGFEVQTYRETPKGRELLSHDRYPSMDKVTELYGDEGIK